MQISPECGLTMTGDGRKKFEPALPICFLKLSGSEKSFSRILHNMDGQITDIGLAYLGIKLRSTRIKVQMIELISPQGGAIDRESVRESRDARPGELGGCFGQSKKSACDTPSS